jgi:hypothetical protein
VGSKTPCRELNGLEVNGFGLFRQAVFPVAAAHKQAPATIADFMQSA